MVDKSVVSHEGNGAISRYDSCITTYPQARKYIELKQVTRPNRTRQFGTASSLQGWVTPRPRFMASEAC